ncbi:MAG: hypothetical protein K2O01_03800, partial [Bacteroidales bacterium]|nr:hypothetical protein [Bacteroidales bacterium]
YFEFIPGGLFIETAPEWEKFEPSFEPGFNTAFCPGDKVTLTATVKYPSGSQRNQYHVALWAPGDHDAFLAGTSSLTPLVELNGNDANAIKDGYELSTTAAATAGGEVTYKITMTPEAFARISNSDAAGNTDYKKTFRIVVTEGAGAPTPSTKPVSKETVAQVANLPKLYLHVSSVYANTQGMQEDYDRTVAAGAYDVVSGMQQNTTVYLRYNCSYAASHPTWSSTCYYPHTADGVSAVSGAVVRQLANGVDKNANATSSTVRGELQLLSEPGTYYVRHNWNNGCVTETDTITITPTKPLAAPEFTITNYDCGPKAGTFEMFATSPDGVTPTDWQWVIRQELCDADGAYGWSPSCLASATSHDQDPLVQPTDNPDFGGGVVFDASHGFSKTSTMATTTWTISAVTNPGKTMAALTVTGGVTSPGSEWRFSNTLLGWWMPTPEIAPNQNACQTNYHWASAANKWVYVRYQTADGWSEWASGFTRVANPMDATPKGTSMSFGTAYSGKDFSISCGQSYVANIGGSNYTVQHPGPDFLSVPAADTAIIAGSPVQLYFTTNVDNGGKFTLLADLLWQVSTDGSTWTTWATTPAGTTVGDKTFVTASGMMGVVEAPSLRYPAQEEQYRIVYNATCVIDPATDGLTNYSKPVTVSMASNMEKGEIVAIVGGTPYTGSYLTLCDDKIDLMIRNQEPGATLQWEMSADGSNWSTWPGKTADQVVFDLFPALNTIDKTVYDNGKSYWFRVLVTKDGETVKTVGYEVKKHYVLKPTLTAKTAKLTTSGICDGEKFEMTVGLAQMWLVANSYQLEAAPNGGNSFAGPVGTNTGYTASPVTLAYSVDGVISMNNANLRFRNANDGCTAYSDTVQIKVVGKPTAGTISPTEFCPGQPVTMVYSGTNSNYYTWSYSDMGIGGMRHVADTSASILTMVIPETALYNNAVTMQVVPMNRRTAANLAGNGYDTTVCAIAVVSQSIKKANNCDVTLAANPIAFCENDLQDVTLTMTPPQPATSGIQLQYKQGGSTYNNVPADKYTLNTATANGYETLTVDKAFFGTVTAGSTPVEFVVVVTPQGGSALSPSGAASVTVKATPVISRTTVAMNPTGGVCAGETLQIGSGASASVGTPTYKWIYAASAADVTNRVFADVPSGDGVHTGTTGNVLTLVTTSSNRTTLNSRYYGLAVSATSDGCTAYDTTTFIQPIINPLPDTAAFIKSITADAVTDATKARHVTLSACSGTSITLSAVTDGTLKNGTLKHSDYTYEWYEGSTLLSNGVGGYAITDNADNTGTACVIPVSAATAGTKTYRLRVTAKASPDNGATYGCERGVVGTYTIVFANCGRDKLKDATAEHDKNTPYVVCESDNNWPIVDVEPATLPASGGGNAAVTAVTLYHRFGTSGAFTAVATKAAGQIPFNVKAAGTTHTQTGSHYYFAKVERTGYAPTYTDTAEYVIGALPESQLASAKVMAKATFTQGGTTTTVAGPTADLTVCAGLMLELSLDGMPADGTDAFAAAGVPKANSYQWRKGTSATVPDAPTGTTVSGSSDIVSLGAAAAGASGQSGYYYAYRIYERQTKINSTGAAKACSTTFKIPAAAKITVNPKPALPTAIASKTEEVCDGDEFDLTTTTTPAAAATGTTWTYRWYKKRGTGSTEIAYPAGGTGTLPNLNAIKVTADADGATAKVTDVYTLKIYGETAEGCVDSTAALSGITVNITPLPSLTAPTVTTTPAGGAVCEGTAATLSVPAVSVSGATVTYEWFKCASGTTQNPDTDNKVGTGTSYTTPATADAAGNYYVRITATPSGNAKCAATVLTANAAVTVNPLPQLGAAFTATTGGVAGYKTSVCKDEEPELTVTPDATLGYTYIYTWPTGAASASTTGGGTWKVAKTETAAAPATKTYSLKIKATTPAGCTKDTTLTFTVEVSACDKDAVQNGRDGTERDETHPFTVCAGEAAAAWPTVKIAAQNMAGRTIEKIELYHSYNSKADADFKLVKSSTPNTLTADLTFDPSTETVSGIDLKQTGSHYYRAIVTRTGNNNNLRTSTVEYVVGAMPEPTVVAGASIMVSLAGTQAAALAAGDGNSLTMCAGPHAYLHLKDMPTLPSGTTHTKYEWFKGTGSTVPADPAAAASAGATAIGTTATVDLGATGGITAQQTDYYYSYHTFARTTPINSTGANQTCDTVYRIGTAGVRIVNPMPVMPTKMDAQTIPVCDGATVNLAAKNIDNSPAAPSGTVWKYRWYKNGTAVSPAAGTLPAASDAYSFTASHGGTAGASNNQVVNDLYTLKVYAETAAGCADSALLNNAVSVQITPEPYADKPVVEAQGGGTGTDGKAYVCEGGTVTLRLKNDPLPNNGNGLAYQWYKFDGTNRTALQNGDVYAGVALRNLTITGKKTDQFGMALAGQYVLVVTVKMNNPDCTAEVVSDAFELGFSERPEVRISAATDKAFTLCPNEGTTLGVTLDDATKSEIAAGTATVTYQWYKGGKTAAVAGATGATLDLNASDVGTPTSDKLEVAYYVKVTKKKVGFECPTEIWSDEAVATTGNGGMGEAFKVTVRKECGKDEIVDADAPTVALTSGVATAICSAEADPGKTFMLKADGDRLAVSKATWYYAPVTEDASGKLVMGTVSKGKECTNIATGATGCPFATKTEGGMLAAGEWRLWVDVERDGANMRTTDTIHFVIRPNPTLTNDPKAIMTKKGEAAEVSDHLVCQGTEIDLKLNEAAVLNTLSDSKDKTETRKETITYSWVCTNCGNTAERVATPVYSFTAPLDRQSVTSSDAPASARYEGNYALKQTYTRAYQRTGAPTYNITCPVVDAAKKPLEKQFPVKVFTSIEPKGSLADASGATSKAYCTDDLTTGASLELVFAPQTSGADATPQAKVTVWEYNVDGGAWQTWATVATGATAPNSLTVDLTDSKLVRPAAGAVKTYNFRVQAANGPCDKEIGTYTLSLYGALTAGTLTVPDAVCADASNTSISVTAAGFAPADATVHFALYASDPASGNVSELVGGDVTGSGASASKTFGLTTTPTVPTKYYVRYQVKNPVAASPCDEVYSTVEEVTVYPSGEISHTGSNGLEVCFEDGTEVTFPLTQKNTTGFDVYAFDAPKTEADLKSAVISGSVTPVASGTGSDNSVTITYDKSASTPAMYQTQTYYYFVAKTGMYAVDKNAACALSIAQTNIKTINPLSAAVLAWDNPQSPSTATELIIDKGRSNKITLTGGEHQRVDRAEIAATLHYAPDDGAGNPDKLKEQTRSNFTSGYSYQFTTEGVWHFWVVVDGTPCDDVTSNTIKATVNPSSELLLTGEQDICSDGDIELAVEVDGDNTKDVVALSVKWYYGSSETGPWTQLSAGTSAGGTVTIAGASPFTMTWTGHGFGQSAESAYHFKMTYSTTGGSDKETPPYKVTVHPKPSLSSLDALNLPAATCDQTAFDIKLKTGVTATSASIAGIKWTLQFTQEDPASAAEGDWTAKSRDAGGDVLHHALNLTDSGYYRLRIEGNAVCPSVTSNAALLTVNSKPEAGTLSMDPATACYNGDAEIKLTGYAGKITGYEYHPLRERADQVSIG